MIMSDKWVEFMLKVDFTRNCYSSGKLKRETKLSGPTITKVTKLLVNRKVLKKEKIGFSLTGKGEVIRSKLLELQTMMEETMETKPKAEQEEEDFEEFEED